ncbi:hypothetical protein Q5P01_017743 [Channa striata]|uniref:Uncharacterized protein n=1 Tax=Channa striata TaxID=64152 RepID=A0AA88SBZ0_CHASR|nr:hypothetical protein Q5P01_017743 [Channa striata]
MKPQHKARSGLVGRSERHSAHTAFVGCDEETGSGQSHDGASLVQTERPARYLTGTLCEASALNDRVIDGRRDSRKKHLAA